MNLHFWKNKKVFITGHTGFKGSWLSLWLQNLGAITCGYALEPNTDPNLFTLAKVAQGMENHIADVRDEKKLADCMSRFQPDIVFHLAAQPLVRYSYEVPVETYSTNVMGTVNVLEAAKKVDSVKVVLNVTTDKCYENKEWIWAYRENDRLGGHDPYSNSKACSELVTNSYRNSFYQKIGKGLASVRAGNVIGGGDWSTDRLIADIMKSIINHQPVIIRNPAAIRPWQHVLEPLSGYLLLAEKLFSDPIQYSDAWNFGPLAHAAVDVEIIVKKLFKLWPSAQAGYKIVPDLNAVHEAHFLKLDITKAVTQLNWHPKLDLDTTIQWIINWYQAWMNQEDLHEFTLQQIKHYQLIGAK
jgi:CDP-glucose 4,6-dehydratase